MLSLRQFPISFFLAFLILSGCASQRRTFGPGEIPQVSTVSQSDEEYGHEVLNTIMDEYALARDDQQISRVREIIDRLAESADSNAAPWHVYLFKDDSVENAAATRGNYIFVWTGILKKVRDDDELAAVLAHELSHVLAGHTQPTSGEEIAQIFSQLGGQVTSEVLASQGSYGILANLAGSLTQAIIGAVVINPEAQRKELEADQIGLFLMAKAKYDPVKAVEFWERMQKEGFGDAGPVQFFSSHPSSDERLEQLYKILPEAQKLKDASAGGSSKDPAYASEWTIKTEQKVKEKIKSKPKVKVPASNPLPVPTPAEFNSVSEPW